MSGKIYEDMTDPCRKNTLLSSDILRHLNFVPSVFPKSDWKEYANKTRRRRYFVAQPLISSDVYGNYRPIRLQRL